MGKVERKFMMRIIKRIENNISDLKTNADLRLLKELIEMEELKQKRIVSKEQMKERMKKMWDGRLKYFQNKKKNKND